MRPIHLCRLDKTRPVLVLTRAGVREDRRWITVAPITSTMRGLLTEVSLGTRNGIDHDCVAACDLITTVPGDALGRLIGYLLPEQEPALAEAISLAFDLETG